MGEDRTVQEILGHCGNPTPSPFYLTPAALRLNLPRSCLGIVIVKYTFILRKRSTSEGIEYVVYTLEPPWWFARAKELRRLY